MTSLVHNEFKCSPIDKDITYSTVMTGAEYKSDFRITYKRRPRASNHGLAMVSNVRIWEEIDDVYNGIPMYFGENDSVIMSSYYVC